MRGCGWVVLLALCLGACEPGRQVPNEVSEPEAQAPSTEAPVPSTSEVSQSVPGGTHLWTHEVPGPGDTFKAAVSVNDQGLTAMLSVFAIPTAPELRTFGSIELLGWDAQGQQRWRYQAPGKAPVDMGWYPWDYRVLPYGAGFLVVNSGERDEYGSNIDFGCSEIVARRYEFNRLLFLDDGGKCSRAVLIEHLPLGVTAREDAIWLARSCLRCQNFSYPPLQWRAPGGQILHERERDPATTQGESRLLHDGVDTLLGWDDRSLSRQSESFDVLWVRQLPVRILGAPAVLPNGELGVVGERLLGKGFSFGNSTLKDGTELVLLRLSGKGEPLSAVETNIQPSKPGELELQIVTDAQGLVAVRDGSTTGQATAHALSWEGLPQWTQALDTRLPGSCKLFVSSVALHPSHGLRVAGVSHGQRAADGSCLPIQGLRRSFVQAFSR